MKTQWMLGCMLYDSSDLRMRAGLLFAGMAVISLVGIMPAALVADKLGRKWTIVPSCLGLASALLLMAVTGTSSPYIQPASTLVVAPPHLFVLLIQPSYFITLLIPGWTLHMHVG